MPKLSQLVASGVLLGSFYLIAGCNAVLGIEPAELDNSVGLAECHWPPADPSVDCHAESCESCADTCKVDPCLADLECRKKLRDYRKCVGDSCDDKKVQCGGCLADNPMAAALLNCIDEKCANCGPAKVATLCESYCGCMDQKCKEDEPGQNLRTCLETCNSQPAWQTYCFWDHCERAPVNNDGFHCHHAAGIGSNCMAPPVVDPNAAACKAPLAYPNGPCNKDEDCCSKSCDMSLGVCD